YSSWLNKSFLLINLSPSFKALGDEITVVLQNIPCSPECKIVGQLLLDHPLSYALTATAVILVVYLQRFWKTVSKVLDTKDTIKFKLDRQEIVYTVDMFRATLQLPVETPANSFIAPTTMKAIEPFMQTLVIKEFVIKCYSVPRFTNLIISDLMKKYPSIPQRLEEDYHFIKCDILLVSVYSTGNVTVLGMLIPDAFITDEIRATGDYREYETVSPTLTVDIALKKKIKQVAGETSSPRKSLKEKLVEEDIEKIVKGKDDEESYASEFGDSVFNDDEDDSGTRIEPGSHKENPENIDDDDENDKEKKDEKKDDYKDKDNDDHTDHTLVRTQATGSMEIRKEKLQTPIPSPSRSPRKNLSSDKNLSQELTESVSPSTATTSKDQSKKIRISNKYNHIPGVIHRMCRRQGYMIQSSRDTNDLIKNNVKRAVADTIIQERNDFQAEVPAMVTNEFVAQAPRIIKELFKSYVSNNVIQVHPTTSTSTATTSSAILQQQLYLKMKSNLKDQATDLELWDVLKRKFEKSSTSTTSCRDDVFRPKYHDDHQEDDTPPEGEKRAKR
ncbi:hypothetical protein Tco_1330749, partial [Tanacetum coccineum]